MDFIKKQSLSTWISLGALVLALVAIILYGVNTAFGYFESLVSAQVVLFGILALVALTALIVLAQFKFEGILGKVISVTVDALKIIVPVLLMLCLFAFISSRAEKLAYLFGSNPEILDVIQTPINMSSAFTAISGFIFFGLGAIAAIAGAFFNLKKADK